MQQPTKHVTKLDTDGVCAMTCIMSSLAEMVQLQFSYKLVVGKFGTMLGWDPLVTWNFGFQALFGNWRASPKD